MKKAVLFFAMLTLIVSVFSGCSSKTAETVSLYFKDANSNSLNEELRSMNTKKTTIEEKARFAVTELIKGPLKETNKPVISDKATLLKLDIKGGVATVNLSKHYSEKTGTEELLLRNALVKTLCSISGIDAIVIQVEGSPIMDADNKEIGRLSINDYTDPHTKEETAIRLYFPNSDKDMLESETRKVEVQNALSLERTVVNELIAGPSKDDLSPSVPAGTKLIKIENNDGVCTVNFSKEFTGSTSGSTLETTLRLYSVVNSLCELDDVESVQILINGEVNAEMGDIVFDTTYYADLSYVK